MNLLNLVPNPMALELPSDLFAKWLEEGFTKHPGKIRLMAGFVAQKAMEWAADQQLMEVNDWLRANGPYEGVRNELSIVQLDSLARELWAAMRPKPPSLKQQGLHALLHMDQGQHNERALIIRLALESIADAARMRWLLDGNGYFMEEEGLCGVHPCSEDEMNKAREIIDEQMLKTGRVHCTAHVDYKPRGDA